MKFPVKQIVEVEVTAIKLELPVRYEDEDIPFDFPLRNGDMWSAVVDIETGKIRGWPQGHPACRVDMKVVDGGTYTALGPGNEVIGQAAGEYVPRCIPGGPGDYVELEIDEQGVITNWPKNPDLSGILDDGD